MANNWKHERAKTAINARIADVETVTIVDYKRDTDLTSIPTNKAYRMDAVHLYVEILNFDDILATTDIDGVTAHRRALKFLNLHQRAVHRILTRTDTRRVDFHNQRLHAVVAKPYGTADEATRVHRAVAVAGLVTDVLAETGEEEDRVPNAKVRIGIDTGLALAVNNGRNGYREPLFLGNPANMAAKFASNGSIVGIYLTNDARRAIGLPELDGGKDSTTALTAQEIQTSVEAAGLGVSKKSIVDEWKKDNTNHPIGSYNFSRSTPPLRDLNFNLLTPANSKRMDTVSVYADIDNFTAYVNAHMEDDPENIVRCLHVIRAELDRVLSSDFGGRRVRFIGDCVHGHLLEGTAHETDGEATVSTGRSARALFAAPLTWHWNGLRPTTCPSATSGWPSASSLVRLPCRGSASRGRARVARSAGPSWERRANRSYATERRRPSARKPTTRAHSQSAPCSAPIGVSRASTMTTSSRA